MGKKILIVDDEPDLIKILEVRLKDDGYEVECASNGQQAVEIVKKGEIGLVFLDFFLPDIDGLEVFKQIRNTAGNEKLPVVFISASAEKIKEIPNEEKTEKLVKPLLPEKILEFSKKYLG